MRKYGNGYGLISVLLILFAVFSCAFKPAATDTSSLRGNTLSAIRITKLGDGEYAFTLRSADKTDFSVLYEKSPYKLVVLAPDTVIGEEVLRYKFSDEVIRGLVFIPERGASRIEILLNDNVDYGYSQEAQALSLKFKPAGRSVSGLESLGVKVDSVSPEKAALASALHSFNNASDNNMLRLEFGLDGVVRYDFGYLDDRTLYVDFFDVTSTLNTKKYPASGVVSDIQAGEYYPPKKVRFVVKVSFRLPVFAGQNGSLLVISSDPAAALGDSRYIASIDALSYGKVQSIIIRTVGKASYTQKVVHNALHIEFDSDVKVLSNVRNRIGFNGLPFKTLELLKIDGKPVIVLTPDKDIFARVDETAKGILISASFEKFAATDLKPQIKSQDRIFLDIVAEKSTLAEMAYTNISTTEKKLKQPLFPMSYAEK